MAVVAIMLTYAFYSTVLYKDEHVIPVSVTVEEKLGINTDTGSLDFGTIPPGSVAERRLNITHQFAQPMQVSVSATGDTAGWLSISENDFALEENQTRGVKVYCKVPYNTTHGNYSGKLHVSFDRVWW